MVEANQPRKKSCGPESQQRPQRTSFLRSSKPSNSRRLAAPLLDVARLHDPRPRISLGLFYAVLDTVSITAAAAGKLASLPISVSPSPTQEPTWYVGDLTLEGLVLFPPSPFPNLAGFPRNICQPLP